jgi:hypothetical protein
MMNTTEKKMTYVDALTAAIACEALPTDVREKLDMLRAQQVKRNTAEKKPTAKQVANEALVEQVYKIIEMAGHPVTVTDIMEVGVCDEGVSNQKCSALVKKLVDAGRVVRTLDKRKAYFSLPEADC